MSDIPLSKKYVHDLKELHTARQKNLITDEELSQRTDELREREAKLQEPFGHVLLMQKLKEAEKETENELEKELLRRKQEADTEEQTKGREHAREIQKAQREKQIEEQRQYQEQQKRNNERYSYREEINIYISHLENNAKNWQMWYTWLQVILLFFSAITAAMAGIDGIPRWVVSITGVIATIAGSLLTTFKIQDRIYAIRKAIAEVKLECQKYDHNIEEYCDTDTEVAFIKFSRSLTSIQGQQMLQEVELWNPKKEDKKEDKSTIENNIQEDKKAKKANELLEEMAQEEDTPENEK